MRKYLLNNKEDLEKLIKIESFNLRSELELRNDIKPTEYPCLVLVYWIEGDSGDLLMSEIIYRYDFINSTKNNE